MSEERIVFSLGTSTRTMEEFTKILRTDAIEMVLDVRSFPTSQFPHFKREALERSMVEEGFQYAYLGEELGGYRKGGYEAYMQTDQYLKGVEHLEGFASKYRCAFFCAERLPWRCHRRFIGLTLKKRGWRVVHILDEKRVWENEGSLKKVNVNAARKSR